ncbi:hypothetical protein CRYUN_Cryun23aG0114200 [Craigia yunnanensis]
MNISGTEGEDSVSATYSHDVGKGVPKAHGGRRNRALIQIPFLIVLGTIGLEGIKCHQSVFIFSGFIESKKRHVLLTIHSFSD